MWVSLVYLNLNKPAIFQIEKLISNICKWVNFENRNEYKSARKECVAAEFSVQAHKYICIHFSTKLLTCMVLEQAGRIICGYGPPAHNI